MNWSRLDRIARGIEPETPRFTPAEAAAIDRELRRRLDELERVKGPEMATAIWQEITAAYRRDLDTDNPNYTGGI